MLKNCFTNKKSKISYRKKFGVNKQMNFKKILKLSWFLYKYLVISVCIEIHTDLNDNKILDPCMTFLCKLS